MAELMQNSGWWDRPDDNDLAAPVPPWEWLAGLNQNCPLGNLPDGCDWQAREAGPERVVDKDGDAEGGDIVYDQSRLEETLHFSTLPYGISLSMNTDW